MAADGGRDLDCLQTDAERDAFAPATHYARTHGLAVPPEAAYCDALPDARTDILHRLICGLLRGRPAGLPVPTVLERPVDSIPDSPEPVADLTPERLASVLGSPEEACSTLALQAFPTADMVLVVPLAARHGYDRFRVGGPVRHWKPADPTSADTVDHPGDLISALDREGAFTDDEQAERIRAELDESVANLALAQLSRAVLGRGVDPAGGAVLDRVADGVPAADHTAAYERIVTDGHPFHPSGKIRRGMSAADGLAYASEFTDRIDLRFVAVRRAVARTVTAGDEDTLTDRLLGTFPGLETALERAVPAGTGRGDYAVIPVHPWQYIHTLPRVYAAQLADDRVVPLPEYTHPATPLCNLRTVVPYETAGTDGPLPHLKLAIDVQTTNVVRTLSPNAVTNGPQISEVLAAIDAVESVERLGFLAEPAATCYYPPGGPHTEGQPFDEARHLSGLWRANPAAHDLVPEGAAPFVASGLLAADPATDRPVVCELIDEYAATVGPPATAEAAVAFVDEYAATVIPEQLRLLTEYGIAVESHLQNSLVVFDGPRPIATLVRDFGGIRVHRERLAERGYAIDPYPDSDVDAIDEPDLYRKLYYALFQNHLTELVATVSWQTGAEEAACWARIREHCEAAFEEMRATDVVPDERVRRDQRALFENPMPHKALTAMRLQGKRHEYVTSQVSNPLAWGQEATTPPP